MSRRSWIDDWRYPLSWAVALIFLGLLDLGITRSPLLWARTSFENDVGPRMVFAQAYQTARKIYAPEVDAELRVALLGNSRMWLGLREKALLAAMQAEASQRSLSVINLSVFGSGPGMMEVIARQLDPVDPALVVLGLSGSDLQMSPERWGQSPVVQLMQRGLSDPAHPPTSWPQRLDRWLRSVWPLYRFREFAHAALVDRIMPTGTGRVLPERFDSRPKLFEYMRPGLGDAMEVGYQRFRARPSLASFLRYLEIGQADHLDAVRKRTRDPYDSEAERINEVALDALLSGLTSRGTPTIVLLMPENPLLGEDEGGEYHQPGASQRGARRIQALAERYAVPVLDGRNWLPVESFLDLDHVMPDIGGLERKLAPEIWQALRSQG